MPMMSISPFHVRGASVWSVRPVPIDVSPEGIPMIPTRLLHETGMLSYTRAPVRGNYIERSRFMSISRRYGRYNRPDRERFAVRPGKPRRSVSAGREADRRKRPQMRADAYR
jgi:hypothetical protein